VIGGRWWAVGEYFGIYSPLIIKEAMDYISFLFYHKGHKALSANGLSHIA